MEAMVVVAAEAAAAAVVVVMFVVAVVIEVGAMVVNVRTVPELEADDNKAMFDEEGPEDE